MEIPPSENTSKLHYCNGRKIHQKIHQSSNNAIERMQPQVINSGCY